ncbi:MAG: hypothetical protein IPN43_14805 [Chitinophagaceae bacterium]|nr:hypothetical protein [Chitinophagaceae bacterium]
MIAYRYRIQHTDGCYWIFLDDILLASLSRGAGNTWHVNIKISGENYLFTTSGKLNPLVNIQNINAGENIGEISLPLLPFFFRRSVFARKDGIQMSWFSKNFFSFHWMWKSNNDVLLEGVEDFTMGNGSGMIKISAYLQESYLLIIAGIFLSLSRKRRGFLGLVNL